MRSGTHSKSTPLKHPHRNKHRISILHLLCDVKAHRGDLCRKRTRSATGQSRLAKLLSAADHLRAGLQAQQGAQTQGCTKAYHDGTAATYCIGRFSIGRFSIGRFSKMSMLLAKKCTVAVCTSLCRSAALQVSHHCVPLVLARSCRDHKTFKPRQASSRKQFSDSLATPT